MAITGHLHLLIDPGAGQLGHFVRRHLPWFKNQLPAILSPHSEMVSCRQIGERIVLGVGEINDRQRALRLVTEEGVGAPSLPRSAPASEICL